jgi:oligopeptide transport system permease protein
MTFLFMLIRLLPYSTPGAPGADMEYAEILREAYGYNEPLLVQYGIFLWNVITKFDWGVSMQIQWLKPVSAVLFDRLPATMFINIFAILISIPVGLILGIYAALRKNKIEDQIISVGVMLAISVPSFVTAFLLQYIFYTKLGWFPAIMAPTDEAGWFTPTTLKSIVLPVISLAVGSIAGFTRYTRAELTEVLTSDFMLLARAKGLTRTQATVRHALRNSMVPIFPMIVGEFISILGGSLIIENIFAVPGVGKLYLTSIQKLDYDVFMFVSMFYVAIGLVAALMVDLSYGIIDPRIRMGGGKAE